MTGDNVTEGYDWHVLRDIPPAHGSGKEPMYGSMGKSTKPDPNRKVTYPQLISLGIMLLGILIIDIIGYYHGNMTLLEVIKNL